ncbi:hypothetical protein D915_006381 [Fasciola hepatica]|uniref:Uncharacterized protein n=1 Tax=Fasciola hepatica TaxID=6192 RepID=A0A4E0R7U0_FASHE|nr:hypothetical protein D915_006381 [Fasciola hepatica]
MKFFLLITIFGVGLILGSEAMTTCPAYKCHGDYLDCVNGCGDDDSCQQQCSAEKTACLRECLYGRPIPFDLWRAWEELSDNEQQESY